MNSFPATSAFSGNQQLRSCLSTLPPFLVFIAALLLAGPIRAAEPLPATGQELIGVMDAAEQAHMELRFQEAIKLYTIAAARAPQNASIYLRRGMAHELANQNQKATDDYVTALRLEPGNYEAMENLAGIYERSGDNVAEAIGLYKRALKLDPRPEWQESLAAWTAMLQTRLRPESESSVGSWHLGNEKASKGQLDEAEFFYSKAIEINPVMYQAYYNRGLVRVQSDNLKGAVEDFSMAVRLSPGFRGAYVQRGLAHELLGESHKAMEDFNLAVKHDPRDPEARYRLGRVLEQQQDLGGAIEQYKQALNLKPKPELRKLIEQRLSALPLASMQASKKPRSLIEVLKKLW